MESQETAGQRQITPLTSDCDLHGMLKHDKAPGLSENSLSSIHYKVFCKMNDSFWAIFHFGFSFT